MVFPSTIKSTKNQYLISFSLIIALSVLCFLFSSFNDYKITAFILLLAVSLLASLYNIRVVIMSAILSAFIWDFFFIPPRFTLTVSSVEDRILLTMYFVITLINAVLTTKIRTYEKELLKKQEKEKTILLYNTILNSLSHELRTPLATIIGTVDALKEGDRHLNKEHKNELLHEISLASLKLNEQIGNLLNMSRLETGVIQLKKDWCDINELIYHTINGINHDSHVLRVEIDSEIPLVKLDYGAIQTVIHNLITNAIHYTEKGSEIDIDIHMKHTLNAHFNENISKILDDKEEKILQINISDNGNGFPKEEITHVFDKFYRLKNTKSAGTGLGLSIVKGFVEAHNGQISLRNNSEKGATFEISIPVETSYLNKLKNE